MRGNLKFMAALVAVALVWALTFPLTKIAVLGGYRTYGITLLSSSLTIVMLGAIVGLRRSGLQHRPPTGERSGSTIGQPV